MFDGIKARLIDQCLVKLLHNNPRLAFIEQTDVTTGEVKCHTATYKGLKIKTYPSGLIEIKGSLHVFYNDGLHNYNDFTIVMLTEAINKIQNELALDARNASLCNLEFGVNIITPFTPNLVLNSLLNYKWKAFSSMNTKGLGMGKECIAYRQYIIKIYNKSLQYRQRQNILRIEKKIMVMCALKFGPVNLYDLLNPILWTHCAKELLNILNDILVNEIINYKSLTKPERRIYNTVINQSNWMHFTRDQRKRHKKYFNKIILTNGMDNYMQTIKVLTEEKLYHLLNA